jgi:hypothetical protein
LLAICLRLSAVRSVVQKLHPLNPPSLMHPVNFINAS